MNTSAKIKRKVAFANVVVIVDTFPFQKNVSMSVVHLCLWSWRHNISGKKDALAISVTVRSNAWVCDRFLDGIAGPNAAGEMNVSCEC